MARANVVLVTVAILLFCGLLVSPSQGQKKNRGKSSTQQARQRLSTALQQRAEAARKLQETRAKLAEAEAKLKTALAKLRKTREELQHRYEAKPEVLQAKRQLRQAQQQYSEAIGPVLGKLHATQDHMKTVEEANRARAELAKLRADDSLQIEQHAKRIMELTRQINLPQQLERDAIRSDPKAAAALERLQQAQTEVSKRVAEARAAAEKDPACLAAVEEVQKSKEELAALERDLELQAGELARAEAALLSARGALALSLQREQTAGGRGHARRRHRAARAHERPAAEKTESGQKPAAKPAAQNQ